MKYIEYLHKNYYSIKTINTYKSILKTYKSVMKDIDLIKEKIESYFSQPNTAWTHYNVLCSYMKYTKDKRLDTLKEIRLPSIPRIYRSVLSKRIIYNKTEGMDNNKKVIVRFLFDTGLRVSELKNIIEIKKRTMVIKGKGNKIREVIHNPQTTMLLSKISVSEKTIRTWVKEILGDKYTPHSIRRSHATHMLIRGANPKTVMKQLGHSKVETTYRYLQLSPKNNIKIYNKYF